MPIFLLHAVIAGFSVVGGWLSAPLTRPVAALAQSHAVMRWSALIAAQDDAEHR
ncbi:hypothetical protein I1A62_00315 (plasmid) [Rhodococcus sp. USK10]|uniref:hypothetical protein n=1 Tax=Rhodococcus sp. USK10 TaxID=2789739 RepID=UPI001C5DD76A|nr:hypothetical protein [Rhodococcus sp. USK10]QYA99612.1 hypothetical protein I1A62_00315 [Rhodococcus sp. USK10]